MWRGLGLAGGQVATVSLLTSYVGYCRELAKVLLQGAAAGAVELILVSVAYAHGRPGASWRLVLLQAPARLDRFGGYILANRSTVSG